MENNKTIERYFFKYAFPCSQVLFQMNKINQKEYNQLKKDFLSGDSPDKQTLERIFSAAFKRIKELAKKMQKKPWDSEVIHKYWQENHNKMINAGDGFYGNAPKSFKDLCKTHIAKVIETKNKMLIVKYNEKKRVVFKILVPEVKIGDKVKIHYGYAIEIV